MESEWDRVRMGGTCFYSSPLSLGPQAEKLISKYRYSLAIILILDQAMHPFHQLLVDAVCLERTNFFQRDGLCKAHVDGRRARIACDHGEQLQRRRKSLAIFTGLLNTRQPVTGGPLPDDSAYQNRNNFRVWCEAEKYSRRVSPFFEGIQCARMDKRIRFNFSGGKCKRGATAA